MITELSAAEMSSTVVNVPPGGRKDDTGKLRMDLIPAEVIEGLAAVYTMGAKKYDDRNWEKGIKFGRIFAAVMRHLWAFWRREDKDSESGLSHLVHAMWGCAALYFFTVHKARYQDLDDRPDPGGGA